VFQHIVLRKDFSGVTLIGKWDRRALLWKTVSQNELLTYLWYLNLGCTLKGLGVIEKCYNHLLMSLTCFYHVLKGIGYDAMIDYTIVVSVSASYSKHDILIDSSSIPHILYCDGHMFFSWL